MLQIKIKNKTYNSKIVLADIDLSVTNGIYGIVGKNGQGKTTFFRCITSLTDYIGSVFLNDKSLVLNEVAWCPTEPIIYDELTAKEFNVFYKELLKIEKVTDSSLFDVPQDMLIKEFSTGMKKKTYLNAVLQKKYSIYLFDEPFNGLDIESNYMLMNYIKNLAKDSVVFVSSHILDILYNNCEKIFLIQNTKVKEFEKNQFEEVEAELFL